MRHLRGPALALLALGVLAAPAPARQVPGFGPSAFTQLAGPAGCFMQAGFDVEHGCRRVAALAPVSRPTLSPDGRQLYVAAAGSLLGGGNGVAVFARAPASGALSPAGCVTATGGDARIGTEGSCATGDALVGAREVAVSPDGRHAYVAASGSSAVAWLARDASTGALTSLGCLKDAPRRDRCGELPNLVGASSVAVSGDGASVYVAATISAAVHVLRRDPATGALTALQCLSATGSDGACARAPGLQGVRDLVVAPDGAAVFAAGAGGAVVAFARDAAAGTLTPAGCVLEDAPAGGPCTRGAGIAGAEAIALSPDGRDLYVAARASEAVASFRVGPGARLRETGCIQRLDRTGLGPAPEVACTPGTAVWQPRAVTVAADGLTVFAGGLDTVTSYSRDPSSGTLAQTGCAEEERSSAACQQVRATVGVNGLAASADGRNVYVTAEEENAVAVLGAGVTVAARVVRVARRTARVPLGCPAARARACAGAVRVGRGAARPFRLRPGARATVRVRVGRAVRRGLARHRRVHATVRASDRAGLLEATTRRVVLTR
jgi:6-phosphogluconolactonase (cycloisomerase 2 family)